MTQGLPAPRGRPARTFAAAGDSGTVRGPVLLSRSRSSFTSRCTSSQCKVRISLHRHPAVRTPQVDAARPALAAPKGGDQSATTGRGPAAIVKISKAAAEASTRANTPGPSLPNELSDAERQVVTKLKATDREVRAHERAHATAGGQHAGAPSYEYQRGPDGRRYAVGGEVPIDTSPVPGDPEATIDKMEIVKRAALAPAEPSGQDRYVAAQADAKKLKAQAELAQQKADERAASAEA